MLSPGQSRWSGYLSSVSPPPFQAVLKSANNLTLQIKVHYNAFKEALRNEGVSSLMNPQRIRDAATSTLFITHCEFYIHNGTLQLDTD